METSTPAHQTPLIQKNDLRRRTLLKNAIDLVDASPLRRRSVLQTPVVALETSNDESERSNRRSLVDIQRRLSNIPQQGSPLNESTKFIGEQEMKDHFQICTKLFAENKITPKNAWQLHIIDLLRHMSQKAGTSETLQVASTSLDISAKVYGIRVDDIHADGLKLASTMARVSEKQTPQQLDEEPGDEPGAEGGDRDSAAAKKKKRRKPLSLDQKNTIAKDPNSLLGALPKLESVFFSTRTNAETSAIDNLFTNVLPMDNSSYKFMLLSKDKAWPNGPDPAVSDVGTDNAKKYPLKITPQKEMTICAPFNDFIVDQWDPEEEEKQLPEKSSIQRENEVVFDDNGIPIAELDGSIHDIFAADDHGDVDHMDVDDEQQEEHQEFQAHIHGDIANIVDFRPEDVQRTEYSYNSVISTHSGKVIDQIWAGPSHWKLKFIRRSSMKFSGQVVDKQALKPAKRKTRPALQMINFENLDNVQIDKRKKQRIKKKPATVDTQKITLPVPDSSSIKLMEQLQELMAKPGTRPVMRSEIENQNPVDYEVSAYNYENPNDSHYCPNSVAHDGDDNDDAGMPDDGDFNDHDEFHMAGQQNFLAENLVDIPELVPKTYITYALQAKKMDMKKLKAAVWHSLTQDRTSQKDLNDRSGMVIPTSFSKLYKSLPEKLTDKMRNELSCPLAFVALLHLCNEQNLKLIQHPSYKDFDIHGPAS